MQNLKYHFSELRDHLYHLLFSFLLTFCVAYNYIDEIIYILATPLIKLKMDVHHFIFTQVSEVFSAYIIISIYVSVILTIILLFIHFFLFIKNGFTKKELILLKRLGFFSFSLFVVSFLMIYYLVLPLLLHFFLGFQSIKSEHSISILLNLRIIDYIFFILKSTTNFLIFFQFPVLLYFLIYTRKVSLLIFIKYRNILYLSIIILSAIITPPDIISQVIFSIALIFLYELTIFILFINKERTK